MTPSLPLSADLILRQGMKFLSIFETKEEWLLSKVVEAELFGSKDVNPNGEVVAARLAEWSLPMPGI